MHKGFLPWWKRESGHFHCKGSDLSCHSHVDHFSVESRELFRKKRVSRQCADTCTEGFLRSMLSTKYLCRDCYGTKSKLPVWNNVLEGGETGSLAIGIGMGQSKAAQVIFLPTLEITQTGEKHTIDGVEIEFQLTRALNHWQR